MTACVITIPSTAAALIVPRWKSSFARLSPLKAPASRISSPAQASMISGFRRMRFDISGLLAEHPYQVSDSGIDQVQAELGPDAYHDGQHDQRDDGDHLAEINILETGQFLVEGPEEHFLDHAQEEGRGHEDADGTDGNVIGPGLESAEEAEEFADEAGQAGQAERSHHLDDHQARVDGEARGQAGESVYVAGMGAVIDHAHQEEQRGGDDAVGAHLKQDACQDHADACGGFDMGQRQPGVEREGRDLDGEADIEGQEDPDLHGQGQQAGLVDQLQHVEGVRRGIEVEREDTQQHEQAAEQGIEEELDGGVLFLGTAPDADQEVHRDQREFPEHVEQEEVQGDEHAQHADLEQEEPEEKFLDPERDVEGIDDGEHRKQAGKRDQGHGKAVDADVIIDIESRDPGELF